MTPTRHEQLAELTRDHGYREATVAGWSDERIATVLASRRRERRNDLKRAKHTAEQIDGSRGVASGLEREAAAKAIEEAVPRGADYLVQTLLYCGHVLSDSEVKALARGMIDTLRGTVPPVERVPFGGDAA